MKRPVRVDLHVHSVYSSDGDTSWLRLLQLNECRTTPRRVYEMARRRGMDYVTITDHDTIDGCLEIAHLDRFFISEEITTAFPEDGAKFHVLAFGISEAQHQSIVSLRNNIYELTAFLHAENIPHAVAHPFYRMGPPLSLEHFEKLLLLFKIFEIRNGGKQIFPETLLERLFTRLSAEEIWRLADKHDLAPFGREPWNKVAIAGSDDHGGILIGYPHTEIEEADTIDALFDHLRMGRCRPSGAGGTPLSVAHGILAVAFNNFRRDPSPWKDTQGYVIWNALGQLFDNTNPGRKPSILLRAFLRLAPNKHFLKTGKKKKRDPFQKSVMKLLHDFPSIEGWLRNGLDFSPENNNRFFRILADWSNNILSDLLSKKHQKFPEDLSELLTGFLPVALYAIALKTEYQDRPLMRLARKRFGGTDSTEGNPVLVFTDGPSREVIQSLVYKHLNLDQTRSLPIYVFGLNDKPAFRDNRVDFKPLGVFTTEAGELQVPPLMDVLYHIMSIDVETIFVRTFGLMGALGILLGKWIGCRTVCLLPARQSDEGRGGVPGFQLQRNGLLWSMLHFSDQIIVTRPSDKVLLARLGVATDKILLLTSGYVSKARDHEHYWMGEPDPEFDSSGMPF